MQPRVHLPALPLMDLHKGDPLPRLRLVFLALLGSIPVKLPFNQRVLGSSPSAPTNVISNLAEMIRTRILLRVATMSPRARGIRAVGSGQL
jgi:hypothetical protein